MELESGQQPNRALRGRLAPWFDHPASWFLLLCASFAGLVLLAPYFGTLAGPARLAAWFVGLSAVVRSARRAFRRALAGRDAPSARWMPRSADCRAWATRRPQGHRGAAAAPRVPRPADPPCESRAVPRPCRARARRQQAQRSRRRDAVHRSRRFQGRQRHHRPLRRRSPRSSRSPSDSPSAPGAATPSRASAVTNSRCCSRT